MQRIYKWFQLRREMLRRWRWLGRGMLVVDVVLLVANFVFPNFNVAFSILFMFLNHLLSPLAARIFVREFHAELRTSGSLEAKIIPKQDKDIQA